MSPPNQTDRHRGFWSPPRVVLTLVVFSLLIGFGAWSCNSPDESANTNNPSEPNRTSNPAEPAGPVLPANVLNAALPAAIGEPIRLSSYSGKVLVINLWATWCGPCRIETPELVRLYREYRSKGVEVVGLSTENPQASAEAVRRFVRDYDIDYRIGWATTEVAIALMQGRDAIPQSFVIAPSGRIIRRFVGFNANSTPPQIRQAIEVALSER
ncbi:MAG TPA: redoxin domain-containing protein [Pyrinomonadaceae bacterium]|nr:redoxin domain-containing protein [Pyrinomonadaceae bacterium]